MKLHVLGSKGAYPPPGDGTSAYLIENEGKFLLLDCGSGAITGLQRFCPVDGLAGIVLSHLHFDHCAELPLIAYALKALGKRLPVFMPDEPAEMFSVLAAPDFDVMPVNGEFIAAGLHFSAMPTVHPCPGFSLRISSADKSLVYTGDTAMHPGLIAFCRGADAVLADANLTEGRRVPVMAHMTALETANIALSSGAESLILTHTPPLGSTDDILAEAVSVFPSATVAARGQSYII